MQSNGRARHVSLESATHVIELVSIVDTYHLYILFDSEINISFRYWEYWKRCILFLFEGCDSQHHNMYCGWRSYLLVDEQNVWFMNFFQTFHVVPFNFDWFGHWRVDTGMLDADPQNIPEVRVFSEMSTISDIYIVLLDIICKHLFF